MQTALRVVTPPATRVVSVAQAKQHVRIDHDIDDVLIQDLIDVATQWVENFVARALITQTFGWSFGDSAALGGGRGGQGLLIPALGLPLGLGQLGVRPLELPRGPVQGVRSVTVVDRLGVPAVLTLGSDLFLDTSLEPGRLRFGGGSLSGLSQGGHVAIVFTAGYGDLPAAVPPSLVMAVKWLTAFLYEERGDAGGEMPSFVKALLWPYRVMSFG